MRKVLTIIITIAALFTLIAAFFSSCFFVDGRFCSIFSRKLDLSDTQADDLSKLERCISLTSLDLSGAKDTDVDSLCLLADLEFLDLTEADIDAWSLFSLVNALPDCEMQYTVILNGDTVDRDTKSIALNDESADDCYALLLLNELEIVDITACSSITDSILEVHKSRSNDFLWQVDICGHTLTSDASELTLDSPSSDELQWLRLFPNLSRAAVVNCTELSAVLELSQEFPECEFIWDVDLCGAKLLSTDTRADISGHIIRDFDLFSEQLAYLPNLEHIDMCGCGLSNEQMEILMERYPNVKFVWEITFGHPLVKWTVRTDITCFSSQGMIRCDDEHIAPLLKYCTDLVALDLGHHNFSDLTPFANLKKLKVLILGDTLISDLSPLAELKELQYLEVFGCRITDVSPLAELPELIDVCIGGNQLSDITPFLSMKQLKMLWVPRCGLSKDDQQQLKEALPDCTFKFVIIDNLCEFWRVTDRNIAIRKAFRNWMYVTDFNNWDDVEYMDGVVLEETFAMTLA